MTKSLTGCVRNVLRRRVLLWVWLLIVLGTATIAAQQEPARHADREGPAYRGSVESAAKGRPHESPDSTTWSRLREGSKITDEIGEFQKTADRFNFYLQNDKRAIRVLENQSLERVARTLENDPSPRSWSVSGVLTEFRGENFLLITRAVLRPRTILTPRPTGTGKATANPKAQ